MIREDKREKCWMCRRNKKEVFEEGKDSDGLGLDIFENRQKFDKMWMDRHDIDFSICPICKWNIYQSMAFQSEEYSEIIFDKEDFRKYAKKQIIEMFKELGD